MRPRILTPLLALGFALLSALAPPAGAQNRPKIPPPDFEREWELDDEGLRQWKAYDVVCTHCKGAKSHECEHCTGNELPICLECDGTKRATCRTCAGTGRMPDPLVELACPYCWGSSWYNCGLCNSWGSLTVEGTETRCGACKQKGLLACVACDGKRRVAVVEVGRKGPGEASVKDLREALETLQTTLAAVEAFQPDSNPSRGIKSFAKTLDPVERDLDPAKDMQDMLERVLKGLKSYGAGYASYEDNLIHQFLVFQDRTVYLLQHQIRLVEQCLALAEFNETKK